ncbi:MAG: protein kinase domain-containing protein [Candidatus Aminicenantia bacterium]
METLDSIIQFIESYLVYIIVFAGLIFFFKFITLLKGKRGEKYKKTDTRESFKKSDYKKAAKKHLKLGNIVGAAQLYEEAGQLKKAAELYVRAQEFLRCGDMWLKNNFKEEALEMFIQGGEYIKAAKILEEMGKLEEAAEMLEKASKYYEAAEMYSKIKDYKKAAELFEKMGYYDKAYGNYEKANELEKAALCLEQNYFVTKKTFPTETQKMNLIKAARLWIEAGKSERAEEILGKERMHAELAQLQEEFKNWAASAENWEKAGNFRKAGNAWEQAGHFKKAHFCLAEVSLEEGNPIEAARHFELAEDWGRAAEIYEWGGDFSKAAECYLKTSNYLSAAENYFKSGDQKSAANMYELAGELLQSAKLYMEIGEFKKASELFEKCGSYYEAAIAAEKHNDDDRALDLFQMVTQGDENYIKAGSLIGQIFLRKGRIDLAIEKFQKLIDSKPLDRENIEIYYNLAVAYEKAGRYREARDIYQRILTEDFRYRGGEVQERLKNVLKLIQDSKSFELISSDKSKRYKIVEKIGEGGMGIVYKAEDILLKRIVALKILHKKLMDNTKAIERFYTEARSAAALNHPNIVTVFDVGQMGEDYFITMEFIEGENFMSLLERKKYLTIPQFIFVATHLFRALDYAHRKGVVHRDIKPHNLMLTKDKQLKIMDFGLAIILSDYKGGETGIISGTPHYMSPEQIQGEKVDHRTDIYSAGATLYHLIAGVPPFTGDNIFFQHLIEPPEPPSGKRHEIPSQIDILILQCLAKEKEKRFQSALEVLIYMKKNLLKFSS